MGRESQELRISDDMVSKAVYPNEVNNQGQINHYKIWLRRLSSAVHFITKNHIKGLLSPQGYFQVHPWSHWTQDFVWLELPQVDDDSDEATTRGWSSCQG